MASNIININTQINSIGSTAYLINIEDTTTNIYGDITIGTTSSEEITTVVNDISGDEEFNKEGIFSPGDKVFFMSGSEDLTETNKDSYYVRYLSDDYKIMTVLQPSSSSVIQVKEVRCKRN